jgi:hypothetical protein
MIRAAFASLSGRVERNSRLSQAGSIYIEHHLIAIRWC